jgi:hypothetical protein
VLAEFRSARASWDRWHSHVATEAEQRNYGRRWRWTALWECIWDEWVLHHRVQGTLREFIDGTERFWHPLMERLQEAVSYDPMIEVIWRDALESGPRRWNDWPRIVQDSWHQMCEREISKSASPGESIPALVHPSASVIHDLVIHPSESSSEVSPKPVPKPSREGSSKSPSKQKLPRSGHTAISCGDSVTDALLDRWRDAVEATGLSRSHANNMRRAIVRLLENHSEVGLMEALRLPAPDRPTAHAVELFQAWYSDHYTEGMSQA